MKFTNAIQNIIFMLLSTMVKGDYTFGRPVTMSFVNANTDSWLVDGQINTSSAFT